MRQKTLQRRFFYFHWNSRGVAQRGGTHFRTLFFTGNDFQSLKLHISISICGVPILVFFLNYWSPGVTRTGPKESLLFVRASVRNQFTRKPYYGIYFFCNWIDINKTKKLTEPFFWFSLNFAREWPRGGVLIFILYFIYSETVW